MIPFNGSDTFVTNLPNKYLVRRIEDTDFDRGVLPVLKELTVVGEVTRQDFGRYVAHLNAHKDTHYTLVVVDTEKDRVIATGSIVIEPKLIHAAGKVGHIEDIAVIKDEQGHRIGMNLLNVLDLIGKQAGAYKNILNCANHKESYYARLGFSKTGSSMTHSFIDK